MKIIYINSFNHTTLVESNYFDKSKYHKSCCWSWIHYLYFYSGVSFLKFSLFEFHYVFHYYIHYSQIYGLDFRKSKISGKMNNVISGRISGLSLARTSLSMHVCPTWRVCWIMVGVAGVLPGVAGRRRVLPGVAGRCRILVRWEPGALASLAAKLVVREIRVVSKVMSKVSYLV